MEKKSNRLCIKPSFGESQAEDYFVGLLDRKRRRDFEEHLERCDFCRQRIKEFEAKALEYLQDLLSIKGGSGAEGGYEVSGGSGGAFQGNHRKTGTEVNDGSRRDIHVGADGTPASNPPSVSPTPRSDVRIHKPYRRD